MDRLTKDDFIDYFRAYMNECVRQLDNDAHLAVVRHSFSNYKEEMRDGILLSVYPPVDRNYSKGLLTATKIPKAVTYDREKMRAWFRETAYSFNEAVLERSGIDRYGQRRTKAPSVESKL